MRYCIAGADLGTGRGADVSPPLPGIRPPVDPKGPLFGTFPEIHFWPTVPKIFLKALLAPIYTNFEGERAPKKRDFFVKIFQKVPKKCPKRAQKFRQNRGKTRLWESSKNQFGRPKKKGRQNFGKFFANPPPPRENPRSAPAAW